MERKVKKLDLFTAVCTAILIILTLVCLLPIVNVLAISFSGQEAIASGKVGFWPVDITLMSYKHIMNDVEFFKSLYVSLKRVLIGPFLNLVLIILCSYPLSKSEKVFPARNIYVWVLYFATLFGGGLVPTYMVVKETGLENLLNERKYSPFTLEESVQIVKKLLALFYVNNINVIRVGLQATDDIQLGKAILDGPYHPAFRELVESEMIKDYLKSIVIENKVKSNILVKTNKKNISKIIGNKKSNSNYMKNELNVILKTKEEIIDTNTLEIVLDDNIEVETNMNHIYESLYKIYNL